MVLDDATARAVRNSGPRVNETLKRIRRPVARGKRVKIASRGTTLGLVSRGAKRVRSGLFPSGLSRGVHKLRALRLSRDVIRRRDKQVKSSSGNDRELCLARFERTLAVAAIIDRELLSVREPLS